MPVPAAYASIKTIDGLTLYAVARRRSDLGYGNTFTSAVEGYVSGHWYSSGSNNYAIAGAKTVQQANVCAEYAFTIPGFPAAEYFLEVYAQQGANPALTDGQPSWIIEDVLWNGQALLPKINSLGNELVDSSPVTLASTQAFNNTGQTAPLPAIALSPVTGTVPGVSTPAFQDDKLTLAIDYPWHQPFQINNFDATGWTEAVWLAKSKPTDADTASILAIKLRNPGAGGDGLIYINGAAPTGGTAASDGSITGMSIVTGNSPSTSFTVNLTALGATIPAGGYAWECAFWISGVKSQFLGTGILYAKQSAIAGSAPL